MRGVKGIELRVHAEVAEKRKRYQVQRTKKGLRMENASPCHPELLKLTITEMQ